MLRKEIKKKIYKVDKLQGKTIYDVIQTEEFISNLTAYLNAQREDRDAIKKSFATAKALGGAKGMKLPAHTIDRLDGITPIKFAEEFSFVLSGISKRSAAEREYITQLGMQAYNLTIANFIIEQFPELREDIFINQNS